MKEEFGQKCVGDVPKLGVKRMNHGDGDVRKIPDVVKKKRVRVENRLVLYEKPPLELSSLTLEASF